MSPDQPASPRYSGLRGYLPRFTLVTLIVLQLLVAAQFALWFNRDPWRKEASFASRGDVSALRFAPGGEILAVGDEDGELWLHRPSTGEALLKLAGHEGGIASLTFSQDGRRLLSTDGKGATLVWETATGAPLLGPVEGPADLSPDGGRVALYRRDTGEVVIRRLDSGPQAVCRRILSAPPDIGIRWLAGGRRIVTGGGGALYDVRDAKTGRVLANLKADAADEVAAVSPDGIWVVITDGAGQMRVFDSESGEKTVDTSCTVSVEPFSPDSERIVVLSSTSFGEGAGIIDAATGTVHTESWDFLAFGPVGGRFITKPAFAQFFPDGRRLLVVDAGARIWDAKRAKLLATLVGSSAAGGSPMSPRGDRLALRSGTNEVTVWKRRRDEFRQGIITMPGFWLTIVFAGLFFWRVHHDERLFEDVDRRAASIDPADDDGGGADGPPALDPTAIESPAAARAFGRIFIGFFFFFDFTFNLANMRINVLPDFFGWVLISSALGMIEGVDAEVGKLRNLANWLAALSLFDVVTFHATVNMGEGFYYTISAAMGVTMAATVMDIEFFWRLCGVVLKMARAVRDHDLAGKAEFRRKFYVFSYVGVVMAFLVLLAAPFMLWALVVVGLVFAVSFFLMMGLMKRTQRMCQGKGRVTSFRRHMRHRREKRIEAGSAADESDPPGDDTTEDDGVPEP